MLTDEQRRFWNDNGFLVLRKFYSPEELQAVADLTESAWTQPPPWLIVDGTRSGARLHLKDVPENERNDRFFKLDDCYLEWPELRELALGRLSPYLNALMGERVVLCNSLSFERGSGQPMHCDSLFMTPQTEGKLIATWIALEDAHPDAGQVFYFPGSHAIPTYRFSNGTRTAIMREMPEWTTYMEKHIAKRRLSKQTFSAQCGDVLIWASDLAHGGSSIVDPQRTRRSLVCHYYSASDCEAIHCDVVPVGEASWMRRPHPPLVVQDPPPGKRRGVIRTWLRNMRVKHRAKASKAT